MKEYKILERKGMGRVTYSSSWVLYGTVPGPVEAVKALAVDSQSVLVAWRPPDKPNGVITKYTVHVDQQDHQVRQPSCF